MLRPYLPTGESLRLKIIISITHYLSPIPHSLMKVLILVQIRLWESIFDR
jgi:hypothetical protein